MIIMGIAVIRNSIIVNLYSIRSTINPFFLTVRIRDQTNASLDQTNASLDQNNEKEERNYSIA
jgi:hypothetical protein